MRNVYQSCKTTLQQQELIRLVFDNPLYFEDHIYRTPYLIPELAHNELKMKEKGCLIKKGDSCQRIPSGGGGESPIEHVVSLLTLLNGLKAGYLLKL